MQAMNQQSFLSGFDSIERWLQGCTYWNLAGQREATARTLLLVIVVIVSSSSSADGAATWHLALPSFVWGLSGWLGYTRETGSYMDGNVLCVFTTLSGVGICVFTYPEVPPFAAISGRGRSWGSLWGWGCTSCVWTLVPAWAPGSHTTRAESTQAESWYQIKNKEITNPSYFQCQHFKMLNMSKNKWHYNSAYIFFLVQ